jgi:sodium/bile acid cotransporter 7
VFALPRADEVAIIFCGSQKSAITGVPMAHLLFTGPAAGMIVLPIIIYHQLQLWIGAWLARRYASVVPSPTAPARCAGTSVAVRSQ